jgi:hypothetical protein
VMLARTARTARADLVDPSGATMQDGADATVVLGEDYRREVEDGFSDNDKD